MCACGDADDDLGFCARCHQSVPRRDDGLHRADLAVMGGLVAFFCVLGMVIGSVILWDSLFL